MIKNITENYKSIFIVLLSMVSVLIVAYLMSLEKSPKIINPKKAGFNVNNFMWDDYIISGRLAPVFENIFPIGTKKSFVDEILSNDPCTTISKKFLISEHLKKTYGVVAGSATDKLLYEDPLFKTVKYFVRYHCPFKRSFLEDLLPNSTPGTSRVTVGFYDDQDRLINMTVYVDTVHRYRGQSAIGQ